MASLVRALLAAGSCEDTARQASGGAHGDDRLGATGRDLLVLTRAQVSAGGNDDAIATIRQALADAGCLVSGWARTLALLAMLQ